jgi:malate dehydrogenase
VDIVEGLPQGKALDLNQSGPVVGYEAQVVGTNGYEETAGSEIVVITSGSPRKPGMSRDDLLETNKGIVDDVCEQVKERSPDAIVIVVTNPLDAMCHVAFDATQFPRQKVIGMAGVLDSARFRTFLAWELGVSVRDVTGFVLGGHGDTMVPVVSYSNVAGIPIRQKLDDQRIEEIVQRTRDGGAEVDSIVLDQKRVLPCAALCQGEYGIEDLFVGVPCKLGAEGIEEIIEIELQDDEREMLAKSADAVKELVQALERVA